MKFIYKIPGYLLLLTGGFCLSWGGLIVRSFDTPDPWQILLLRSSFFFVGVSLFLVSIYKQNTIKAMLKAGLPGFSGGFVMSFSFIAFVFAMMNTSVATRSSTSMISSFTIDLIQGPDLYRTRDLRRPQSLHSF